MRRASAWACLIMGFVAVTASAQDKRGDVFEAFGGYSMTRHVGDTAHGWNVTLAWNMGRQLGPRLDLVADLSGHQATLADGRINYLSYMAGPRFRLTTGKTRLSVHTLAGGAQMRESITLRAFGDVDFGEWRSGLAMLLGGGLNYALTDRLDLQLAGDYYGIDTAEGSERGPRASLGLAYRFGARTTR
jgi:opacity protein-like surface antigen